MKLTRRQLTFFEGVFGHMQLRYTATRIYSSFRGSKDVGSYEILGVDDTSVAVGITLGGAQEISHIHFEGQHYWISLNGVMREYFRRVRTRDRS